MATTTTPEEAMTEPYDYDAAMAAWGPATGDEIEPYDGPTPDDDDDADGRDWHGMDDLAGDR